MSRKTKTPKWLSILRKLYTYIGTTGIFTALTGRFGLTAEDMVLILEIYIIGGFAIQTVCDTFFIKEKESKFPTEAKNIRE